MNLMDLIGKAIENVNKHTGGDFSSPVSDLFRNAQISPQKVAVIAEHSQTTYEQLSEYVLRLGFALSRRGITRGELVGIESESPLDHLISSLATQLVGGVAVALPYDCLESFLDTLRISRPKLILSGIVSSYRALDIPQLKVWEEIDSSIPDKADFILPIDPNANAMIYFTSGTSSGVRKGVLQSYQTISDTTHYIVEITQINNEIVEYVATTTDNAYWFGRCRSILHVGGTMVINRGTLNPIKIFASIKNGKCNAVSGDTPIFMIFVKQMRAHMKELGPNLRWAKIASQAMPLSEKRELTELLPNARIVMGYGLTEAMRCCLLSWKDHPDKLESVGKPCPGVLIRVVDEKGMSVPSGISGEIQVKGVNLASGYLGNPGLWSTRIQDGWYRTGDLGYLDESGYLYIQTRLDFAINVGGRKIAPSEVEEAIRPLMKNQDFIVTGFRDPNGILGDVVALCVEGEWSESLEWKEFRVRLFEKISPHLVPKKAFVLQTLPRTGNQKIQRNLIRQNIELNQYEAL